MKKLYFLLCIVMIACTSSFAQKGTKSIGGNLVFQTDGSTMGIGAKFRYNITDPIRIEPSLTYYFVDGVTSLDANINGHYVFNFKNNFSAYPLAGMVIYHSSVDGYSATNVGLNLGGGAEYHINQKWAVGAEAKYAIVENYASFFINLGFTYSF